MSEILFLAINVIDCILSAYAISQAKLQLVRITTLFIASKVEEIASLSIMNFLNCITAFYTKNEMPQAE